MIVPTTQTLYADIDNLKARVRRDVLLNCLDWDRDGSLDADAVTGIVSPASTDIDMALQTAGSIYPTFKPPFPPSLVEIAIDGMRWRLGAGYPSFYVIDHVALYHYTEKRITEIRLGKLTLGQTPPETSAIQGGHIFPNPRRVERGHVGAIFANNGTRKWGGVF